MGYDFDINDNRSPYLSQKKLYKGASADYIAMAKDWNAEVKQYNGRLKSIFKRNLKWRWSISP